MNKTEKTLIDLHLAMTLTHYLKVIKARDNMEPSVYPHDENPDGFL